MLPIEWSEVVHESRWKEKLKEVTVQNLTTLRGFTNHVMMDVLFFMDTAFHDEICYRVQNRLELVYKR